MSDVTRILSAIEHGDPQAAAQLLPLIYNELRKLAAQRLLRTLNPKPRIRYDIGDTGATFEDVAGMLAHGEGQAIYGPDASDAESQGGYSFRSGLFEVMSMDDEIHEVIHRGGSRDEIQSKAIENGMLDFRRAALLKVARGDTSIEEMMRVLPADILELDG